MAARDPRANGLPAERTTLAWTRTSFAFLANGALLTLKDLHSYYPPEAPTRLSERMSPTTEMSLARPNAVLGFATVAR